MATMNKMRGSARWLLGVAFAMGAERVALANDEKDEPFEHTIIFGVGGTAELELGEGSLHPGGNVMVEWDAIENWLELEVSTSVLAAEKGIEVPIDLIVKKPFRVTRNFEFMIGIGPELVHVFTPTTKATYFGGALALDFMYWPSCHVGLWIEPSYDFTLRNGGVSHGLGSTGGLLIGW